MCQGVFSGGFERPYQQPLSCVLQTKQKMVSWKKNAEIEQEMKDRVGVSGCRDISTAPLSLVLLGVCFLNFL